jgi:hypothetical protein
VELVPLALGVTTRLPSWNSQAGRLRMVKGLAAAVAAAGRSSLLPPSPP